MTWNGQEVFDVFVTEITNIICISVIRIISVINVTSVIIAVKCSNVYNDVIRVRFYNYFKAKVTCVIRVL